MICKMGMSVALGIFEQAWGGSFIVGEVDVDGVTLITRRATARSERHEG